MISIVGRAISRSRGRRPVARRLESRRGFNGSAGCATDGSHRKRDDGSASAGASAAPPSSRLAWGAAASAVAASLAASNPSDKYDDRSLNRRVYTRWYRSTSTYCESSGSDPSNNSRDDAKSDSFFDMAQQWASDYARNKSKEANDGGRIGGAASAKSNDRDESMRTPEELLEAMGILGYADRYDKTLRETSESSRGEDTKDEANDDDSEPNKLKGLARKVMFKFDEFQSSLPKPPRTAKEEENSQASQIEEDKADDNSSGIFSEFLSFANNASLFTRKTSDDTPDIEELIQRAQNIADHISSPSSDGSTSPSRSESLTSSGLLSQVLYFQQNAQAIQRTFESSFGPHLANVNVRDIFQSLPVAAMHYYLEHQDSIKTPSWKRRMHRFCRDVEVSRVEELNEALILSELSYADSVDEIRKGLQRLNDGTKKNKPEWELLFCDTQSQPNRPSHFLAIQKNASKYDDALRALMVVRGTKSMSDLMTDAMMEATDYEYNLPGERDEDVTIQGKAHGGIIQSGRYLVDRHQKLLSTLLKLSKKRKLEITLIGHSLGAGAATIAAMEWNSKPLEQEDEGMTKRDKGKDDVLVSAHVIGFGCPALLSQPLSLATKDYVTTVIADADFIPRMSGATLINLLLDVSSFDYKEQAERDVEQALREVQSRFAGPSQPLVPSAKSKTKLMFNIDEDDIQTVMGYVHRGLEKVAPASPEEISTTRQTEEDDAKSSRTEFGDGTEKMEPVLFPPGTCVHFYRDGSSISGTYVPCTFFNEIDVARTMIDDHLISSGYRRIFLNLMRDFHKDDHFSFDSKRSDK